MTAMEKRQKYYDRIREKERSRIDLLWKTLLQDKEWERVMRQKLRAEAALVAVEVKGGTPEEINERKKALQKVQEQQARILSRNGKTVDDLRPKRICQKCEDNGYTADFKLCDCYPKARLIEGIV